MKEITGHTKLTGLIGSPVEHSISPMMHNEAFRQLNLDYAYLAFDIEPAALTDTIAGFKAMHVKGFNVTMPHKNAICELCDSLSPAAEISHAVNTVVNEHGKFVGYNTDGIGFMRAMREGGIQLIGKKMTVLGTGGAATAIFVQAALDGVSDISIFNRKGTGYERAKTQVETLHKKYNCNIKLFDIQDTSALQRELADSTLLVNATSVGMAPDTDASIIENMELFHKDLYVADIIYNPRETKFLKFAKKAGCRTQNGLMMLLYQGAEAFRLWTGVDMPIAHIREKYFD